jgi:hypothetical protein
VLRVIAARDRLACRRRTASCARKFVAPLLSGQEVARSAGRAARRAHRLRGRVAGRVVLRGDSPPRHPLAPRPVLQSARAARVGPRAGG